MKAALRTVTLFVLVGAAPGVAAAQSSTNATLPHSDSSSSDQSPPMQAAPGSPESPVTGVVASVRFDVTNSSQGNFIQLVPDVGYKFNTWGLDFGMPLDFTSASAAATAAASRRGVGDMYLSAYYSADWNAVYWKTTLTGTAPTGDAAIGLGTGQATWSWTNHFDRDFDWISPFIDAGLGSSLNPSTSLSARISSTRGAKHGAKHVSRAITEPYTTVGKLANLEIGAAFQPRRALGFSVSVSDIIPWGEQTVLSRFIPQPKQPASSTEHRSAKSSQSTKGQRPFEVSQVTRGTASLTRDNGFSASATVTPTSYFDLSVTYSRSVPMKLDILSVSIGTNLTTLFR